MQADAPPLILASASAARAGLLRNAGVMFSVQPVALDEGELKRRMTAEPPGRVAMALADAKAAMIDEPDAMVIGADQVLVCDGTSFDKPAGLAVAASHLRALRGRSHTLATAVTCWRQGAAVWRHLATPSLTMRDVCDGFIEEYLALEGDSCLGSVGAYRLEGPGIQLFSRVEGDHSAILGLPLLPLLNFLREAGVLLS